MDPESNLILLITNITTLILWVISELLGISKCKPNSVFQLFFSIPCWNGDLEVEFIPRPQSPTAATTTTVATN